MKEELKAETENVSDVLWKENKEDRKHQKVKVRNNKETEMGEAKQISKQEEMRKCNESRQVGGTEKVGEKSKEAPLKDRRKRIIKNETNEEKSLIRIKRGQGNKKQEKREERQFPHPRQLVVESIIDLDKIREIIPEKRYYHKYNETIWSYIYK